jgi:succinylarginine dihydrolase
MTIFEANFDGLVGPTHNYAGLSQGNLAATRSAGQVSRPKAAALEGLAKMRQVGAMGVVQGMLPPHQRPYLPLLRALGFEGTPAQLIAKAHKADPVLLAQVYSAASMWTANAATVSPSTDTADARVHFTPANLRSMLHRSIEAAQTARTLRAVFHDQAHFAVHEPLPAADALGDEGAANHTRLFDDTKPDRPGKGVHLFVYGVQHALPAAKRNAPKKFPPRQTLEASLAIARRHGLDLARCVFAQQSPKAIDAGAFHNDVVCVGTGRVLLYHAGAFADKARVLRALRRLVGPAFTPVEVGTPLTLKDAVDTYLFNSQLLTLHDGSYHLVAPAEVRTSPRARRALDALSSRKKTPITATLVDVRQSMRNGGGPACLRLRVPLTDAQAQAVTPGCMCTSGQLDKVEAWVHQHYPDKLTPKDLADPKLIRTSFDALDELTAILGIGAVYPFQHE